MSKGRPATKIEVELASSICEKQDEIHKLRERIKELEGKIERAKDITNSQSFWCELADKECVGMKSIVHLVEQALKG